MIAVVIPCYRVKEKVLSVIKAIGPEVNLIICVDDACPDNSGEFIKKNCTDKRVKVLNHAINQGVGGAMLSGYQEAIQLGAQIIVKIDGDGQLNPKLIPHFIKPILNGYADYTKGNRFFSWELLASMPKVRLFGNSLLSFVNKIVSGYWTIMDPTNGYTAVSASVLKHLPLHKIDKRYFFESDMLFRLGTVRAKVVDIPMQAIYSDEISSLSTVHSALTFPAKFLSRFVKRITYNYFLRDFNMGSMYILSGTTLIAFGVIFGVAKWTQSVETLASSGTVMLAALPTLIGFQSLVQFISYDILIEPKSAIHTLLKE